MGLFRRNKKESNTDIVKSAYKLGYDIGFHKHNEYWGWIRRNKKELFDEARSAGLYDAALFEFDKGKKEGHFAKKRQVYGKPIKKASVIQVKPLKREFKGLTEEPKKKSFLEDNQSLLDLVKKTFIGKPLHITRATFVDLPKLVKMPKFLRTNNYKK